MTLPFAMHQVCSAPMAPSERELSNGIFTKCHLTEGENISIRSLPQSKIGSEKPIFASPLPEGAFPGRVTDPPLQSPI